MKVADNNNKTLAYNRIWQFTTVNYESVIIYSTPYRKAAKTFPAKTFPTKTFPAKT